MGPGFTYTMIGVGGVVISGERTLLFDLDMAIQRTSRDCPDQPGAVQLTGVYHNLLRRWADV